MTTDMNIDDYDSALLFNEDGTADMSIRKLADEDEVSEGTLRAVAISFCLQTTILNSWKS